MRGFVVVFSLQLCCGTLTFIDVQLFSGICAGASEAEEVTTARIKVICEHNYIQTRFTLPGFAAVANYVVYTLEMVYVADSFCC